MKQKIKKIAQYIVNPLALKLGYVKRNEVINIRNKNSLISNFCKSLIKTGFIPKHIIDIGANRGGWTRVILEYFPDAYYTLFEPQPWLKQFMGNLLSNNKITLNQIGVGDQSGILSFTIVDREDSCSFKYNKEEAEELGYQQVEIPVVTLNEHLKKSNKPNPDIIKIDAEGFDLKVLKGASNYFGKTEVFLVEVGVMNKDFKNSCLEVMIFMEQNGYTLFDVTDLNRPYKNCLWLMELVFVKKDGIINTFDFTH